MSRPTLDPQVVELLRLAQQSEAPPVEAMTPEENRANFVRVAREQFGPVEEVHAVEDRDADGVPVRIYRPVEASGPSSALVYLHGGGWVIGSVDTHDGITRALARRAGCVVVSVDYRLAPEHPYPAALDDAWTAASWTAEHAVELGIDRERIAVGGDSVGGCLAAIVARRGRDRGAPFVAQLLIYPTTTCRQDAPSVSSFATGYGLTRDAMAWYWRQYIADYDGAADIDVSPAAVQDLRRLPRAIVVTAEADILRDEAEAYAQRLALQGGVEAEQRRYEGMIHGFLRLAGVVDRADQALDDIAGSLASLLDTAWRDDVTVGLGGATGGRTEQAPPA